MRRNKICFNWLSIFLFSVFLLSSCNANPKSVETLVSSGLSKDVNPASSELVDENRNPQASGTYLPDFKRAAKKSVDAVVHVKSMVDGKPMTYDDVIMEFLFGYREERKQEQFLFSTGSGVILSEDGYIVTNLHVIKGADEVHITMNDKRDYKADLVGYDAQTDLALLKIEEENLPFLKFGDSDLLELGEWVLAIGNPFRLSTTVTAGIVSAKARNINLLQGRDRTAIESFIQTDAAVNPGNSGGALVNLNGELVGINTAIASPTGSFAGYSFAIPSSLVQKIVEDLKSTGKVSRGIMGVSILNITDELVKMYDLDDINGVFIEGVIKNGAAHRAGIVPGDIIVEINDVKVGTTNDLQERVARYRPNDIIEVKVKRKNKFETFNVKLRTSE